MNQTNKLTQEIHENAKAHGWWDKERSFGEVIALCHSELSEALEEYRNGRHPADVYFTGGTFSADNTEYEGGSGRCVNQKPEGIAIELADCIIRILDYCGKKKRDIDGVIEARNIQLKEGDQDMITNGKFGELIAEWHTCLSLSLIGARSGTTDEFEDLAYLLVFIRAYCRHVSIDIDQAIRTKHEYNKTRPYKHGGKII